MCGALTGLVDGSREPSRFHLDFASRDVTEAVVGRDGPGELECSLIATLLEYLLASEEEIGNLLDIEWALDDEQLWLLQARPMTSIAPDSSLYPARCATSWFFDQRFLEPIRPLTRTALVPTILRLSLIEPLEKLGQPVPEPLETFFGGQIYVAHEVYRRLLGPVPVRLLTPDTRQFFPEVCFCAQREKQRFASVRRRLGYAIAVSRLAAFEWQASLWNVSSWKRLKLSLRRELARLEPADLSSREAWIRRWDRLEELTVRFLRLHRWSIMLADFFWHLSFALKRRRGGPAAQLEAELHRAASLPTTAANRRLTTLLRRPKPAPEELAEFVETYGHRSASLDFAIPTWAELLRQGGFPQPRDNPPPPPAPPRHASDFHRSHRHSFLFRHLVHLIEMREEQRFEWERVLAEQRRMLSAAGNCLARRGAIEVPEDVWFLQWQEFLAALFDASHPDLWRLRLRKHEFRFDRRVRTPLFIGPGRVGQPVAVGRILDGLGGSRGIATGKVLVLAKHARTTIDVPRGAILVTRSLDPAMTVLLPSVAGVILERGGILSHAAILAREYGVPLVVAGSEATEILQNGTEVTIDGDRGLVEIHDDSKKRPAGG